MAINARQKGKVGEALVKKFLEDKTGLIFSYTPGSGIGKIKGDLFIEGCKNVFCIEVKNYAEPPNLSSALINKSNDFVGWWTKLQKQSGPLRPLLIFKYNRSKLFIATDIKPVNSNIYIDLPWLNCYIVDSEWIEREPIQWLILPTK